MQFPHVLKRAPSRHAFISAGAPILGLVMLVIAGAFAVFINFAQQQDRSYVDNSRRLVTNTLQGRLRALADVIIDYGTWNEAFDAVSLRWNGAWVASNFYSPVTDGMVIFRGDGTVRYVWQAQSLRSNATALGYEITNAARNAPLFNTLRTAPLASGTVTRTFALINGRLALLAVAAIGPENDAARVRRFASAPVDYVAAVDILDAPQLATLASELDLGDLSLTQRTTADPGAVSLPVRAANGALVGYVHWDNRHPGSTAFAGEIGPVVVGVIGIGILSVLLALALMRREVAAATRIEAAIESSRLKSEFISNMSHELRTPLDAIMGYAELIKEEAPKTDLFASVQKDAGRISKSAGQLRRLIDDVLDHTRIDAGRLQLTPEPIEVSELFAEIEDALGPAAREQTDLLTFSCAETDLALVSDHQRLRQCLLNLIENSISFTRGGKIGVSARRDIVGETEAMVFDVADNGLGVARGSAAALFEPFAPTSDGAARVRRGATLSLSLSRKLARAMGGDITFEADPSGGAHFTLWTPMGAQAAMTRVA